MTAKIERFLPWRPRPIAKPASADRRHLAISPMSTRLLSSRRSWNSSDSELNSLICDPAYEHADQPQPHVRDRLLWHRVDAYQMVYLKKGGLSLQCTDRLVRLLRFSEEM